ncbi:MAG TPA: transcriptional regulator [Kofleriaceae bacterium]|nr:transcriptional regulator [Kofleriaceae bacterium]
MPKLPDLDPVIHGKVRLAILSILAGAEEADFTYLRDQLDTTDGNLSVHLSKLEKARYIAVRKRFIDKRPNSAYRMTEKGRQAFADYVQAVKALLGQQLR